MIVDTRRDKHGTVRETKQKQRKRTNKVTMAARATKRDVPLSHITSKKCSILYLTVVLLASLLICRTESASISSSQRRPFGEKSRRPFSSSSVRSDGYGSTRRVVENELDNILSTLSLVLRRICASSSSDTKRSIADHRYSPNPLTVRGGGGADTANEVEEDDEEEEDDEDDDDEDKADNQIDAFFDEDDEAEQTESDEADEDEAEMDQKDIVVASDKKRRGKKTKQTEVQQFVEPLFMNTNMKLLTTVGTLVLCRKIDMFDPKIVRMIRFSFIAFLIVQQVFVLYVRIRAKMNNDRTDIEMTSPISGLLQQNQVADALGEQTAVMKNLASMFLKSKTTVMEYDMMQASKMQGRIITEMIFCWFLHFKLGQTQPVVMSVVNGLMNLFYNPLFQVYVIGRNLERPFKSPPPPQPMINPPGAAGTQQPDDTETESKETEAIKVLKAEKVQRNNVFDDEDEGDKDDNNVDDAETETGDGDDDDDDATDEDEQG